MVADMECPPFSKLLDPPLISAEKIQKITNPVNWILSKRVREVFTMIIAWTKIQLLWATVRLLVTLFNPYLPSWRVLLQGNKEMVSVQDIILLFYVWCESRELGGGSSGISYVTSMVGIFCLWLKHCMHFV